jgi:hypothetical protein
VANDRYVGLPAGHAPGLQRFAASDNYAIDYGIQALPAAIQAQLYRNTGLRGQRAADLISGH